MFKMIETVKLPLPGVYKLDIIFKIYFCKLKLTIATIVRFIISIKMKLLSIRHKTMNVSLADTRVIYQ